MPSEAFEYLLSHDPKLGALMQGIGDLEPWERRFENHFEALARAIVGQQLSTTVARVIWGRLEEKFGTETDLVRLAASSDEELRAIGLSRQKAGYLRALATHVLEDTLNLNEVDSMTDDDVILAVTAVKGLGVWTAQMFLMFHLGRPDVLPVGDLGIREGFKRLYELEDRPSPKQMEELAEPWRPYRTLACRYLWKSLEVKPV